MKTNKTYKQALNSVTVDNTTYNGSTNSEKMKAEDLVKINLTIRALEIYFGEDFCWRTAVAEIIGVNPKTNKFVIIDDGNCYDDSWMYSIYDFEGCEITALEWFEKCYKYPIDYAKCIGQEWFYYNGKTLNKTTARKLIEIKYNK